MPDEKRPDPEDQTSRMTKEQGDTPSLERLMFGIETLVVELCHEPFEFEAEEEDVTTLRTEMLRRAKLYAAKLEKSSGPETQER
jgi:hypothetical protein